MMSIEEKVRRYREARGQLDEMKGKMERREPITPQELTETLRVVEAALAAIVCPDRIRGLKDGCDITCNEIESLNAHDQ